MSEIRRPADQADWLPEPKKLPEMLNVITILTFVGSAIAIIIQLRSYFTAQSTYDKMAQLDLNNVPGF
jgi:hypothetical protein